MSETAATAVRKGLSGRKAEAARNDGIILAAAREVFLADPSAPIAAVAERAGVGISALYRRYSSKEVLLGTLCLDGLRRYNAEAEAALDNPDDWQALVEFLDRVVAADVHSLTVRLAGTFTPGPEFMPEVQHSAELNEQILARARRSGRLRAGVTVADLGLVLEACASVALPDAARAAELRRRVLTLLVDGLATAGELPGPAPEPGEFAHRWRSGGPA
ncbi:TetR/AcrR family transcriptional regulator [Nocardia sp. alder85J]|uniref:TetR/AcrR family transcriptional regulator n=1 Tax=Nocardia sp. alder85J TaxID=2862949 RepID=UPI001CD1CE99|nr:TetR/AcrR family transcriptional regulator [Nocardia sp. alder85J]MCX4098974.1 TetR/AcrR family transcriptional regulator [Nocardia sp. alder85J]